MKTTVEHERELIHIIIDAMRELSECTEMKDIRCEYESPHIRDKYDTDKEALEERITIEASTSLDTERKVIQLYSLRKCEKMI